MKLIEANIVWLDSTDLVSLEIAKEDYEWQQTYDIDELTGLLDAMRTEASNALDVLSSLWDRESEKAACEANIITPHTSELLLYQMRIILATELMDELAAFDKPLH